MSARLLHLLALAALAFVLAWAFRAWLDPATVATFLNQTVMCN